MADFGADAASLGPAQAQLSPVAPVQEQATANPLTSLVTGVGDFLAKGLEEKVKDDQLQQKNAVLSQVAQSEATLNQAMDQGAISATEAASRSRANYNKYLASYPQYATEINGLNTAFKSSTETGDRDTQLANQADIKKAQINQAVSQGYYIPPTASPTQIDNIVQASQSGIQAQKTFELATAHAQAEREAGRFTTEQQNAELKRATGTALIQVTGDTLTGFSSTIDAAIKDVQAGGDPVKNQFAINQYNNKIQAQLAALAVQNPELAAPFKEIFTNVATLGQKLADPKQYTADLKEQYDAQITKGKLLAIQDPDIRSAAVASSLFPGSAMLAVPQAAAVGRVLFTAGNTTTSNGVQSGYAPQIVGNPQVESDAFKVLRAGLGNLNNGKVSDPIKASVEASNSVNVVLKQVGDQINNGAARTNPGLLKNAASFFASPEYAQYVTSGHVDATAQAAAKHTFQAIYEPAVIDAIGGQLKGTLAESPTSTPIAQAVDTKFTGAGVVFVPSSKPKDAQEAQQQAAVVANLNQAQAGLNQLIHIGAHMEGSTNYQKYWEENKHIYLPQVYPDPAKLKEGQVVNGKKYIGGNYTNPDNWQVVTSGVDR